MLLLKVWVHRQRIGYFTIFLFLSVLNLGNSGKDKDLRRLGPPLMQPFLKCFKDTVHKKVFIFDQFIDFRNWPKITLSSWFYRLQLFSAKLCNLVYHGIISLSISYYISGTLTNSDKLWISMYYGDCDLQLCRTQTLLPSSSFNYDLEVQLHLKIQRHQLCSARCILANAVWEWYRFHAAESIAVAWDLIVYGRYTCCTTSTDFLFQNLEDIKKS